MTTRPVIVGLVGGIASGKSTVARELGAKGARVVDADAIAHEVLADPAVRERVLGIFGPAVLDGKGHPDRRRIADVAFRDPEKLRALERVVHPLVRERIRKEIEAAGDAPAIVIDAPLLLEGGLHRIADRIVFVSAPAASRRERAARERGWGPDELDRREGRQAPIPDKERIATHVIENDGDRADLARRAADLWKELLRPAEDASDE